MYIKYEFIGDRNLIFIPDNKLWSLRFRMFDEDGNEDYSVYLTVEGSDPIRILDVDQFCQGNPDLPYYAVGHLYEDLIDTAAEQIRTNPAECVLDISDLVSQLVLSKYKAIWVEKGYIPSHWRDCE